jgi:hypothetical protein
MGRQTSREQNRRGEIQRGQTTGQARDTERTQRSETGRRGTPSTAQTRESEQRQKGGAGAATQEHATTGTATHKQAPSQPSQAQSLQQNRAGATTQGANTTTQGQSTKQGRTGTAAQNQMPGQTGAVNQSLSGRTSVTAQQQATIRQSVLSARNVPRVDANRINFAVNPGVVVPASFAIVSVATFPILIDTFPAFRDDSFFVVGDEMVFLDQDRRVVDVVPVGPRTHFSHRSTGSGSVAALNLSAGQIREVQQVLIDDGLLTGEADGVLGSRTREALITFQRQQGIEATGSIDTGTIAALGMSNKIGEGTNQSSTVGQGQTGSQQSAPQTTTGQGTGQTTTGQGAASPTGQGTSQTTTGQGTGQLNATTQQNQSTTGQSAQHGATGQAAPAPSTSGQGGGQTPAQNQDQKTGK